MNMSMVSGWDLFGKGNTDRMLAGGMVYERAK